MILRLGVSVHSVQYFSNKDGACVGDAMELLDCANEVYRQWRNYGFGGYSAIGGHVSLTVI